MSFKRMIDKCKTLHNFLKSDKTEKNVVNRDENKSNGFFKSFKKSTLVRICSVVLVSVLVFGAIAFSFRENVAYASEPVLWGHKGKDGVTNVSESEIARFDNNPALYDDEIWGKFISGGINRVNKAHTVLPKKYIGGVASDLGTGVMDTYTGYISRNVSVVRYGGGSFSNLGISVNSEAFGYIKMDVSSIEGRYLYYSVSIESLTSAAGSAFGTFAVDIGSAKGIVARTEKNSCGGVAYISAPIDGSYVQKYTDSNNWVNGHEYGCIDLKALTNNEKEKVKSVYLFGTSKTKVLLNYLIISDEAPTKIDVAQGNILASDSTEGDDTPEGVVRTYAGEDGCSGTATLELSSNPSRFSFENLVVDMKYTPYLYYSFTVDSSSEGTLSFFAKNSTVYVAKQTNGSNVLKSVTGCIKISSLLGEDGIVNVSNASERARSFTFKEKGKLTVNSLFFRAGLDVIRGEHVIVKNADSINTSKAGNYLVTDFTNNKAIPSSYTYLNSTFAPFSAEIRTNINVDFCWYVNTVDSLNNAVRIGSKNTASSNVTATINGITINASIEKSETTGQQKQINTTLKVKNPTKMHNGLYFFCLIVSKKTSGDYSFPSPLSTNSLDEYLSFTNEFCRLEVANNIVYHGVNKDGVEIGVIEEDWIIYGTDSKIKDTFETQFVSDGNYLKYDSYSSEGERLSNDAPLCDDGYKTLEYSYSDIAPGSTAELFKGWMLFDETIRNPHGTKDYNGYLEDYKAFLGTSNYNDEVEHKFWTIPGNASFTMIGDKIGNKTVIHDTTLNLYTQWEIPVDANKFNINVFVDQYGTTFIANEKDQIISADKNQNGENKFISDVIYAAVVPLNSSTSVTIGSGTGIMQYTIDNGQNWIDVTDNASAIKDIFTQETNFDGAKAWYITNTDTFTNGDDIVYALKMDTDDLLKNFGRSDGDHGPDSTFEIRFRYIAGISDNGSWFNFMGKAECGHFKFIPLKYSVLD